jgi:hypothetical protein
MSFSCHHSDFIFLFNFERQAERFNLLFFVHPLWRQPLGLIIRRFVLVLKGKWKGVMSREIDPGAENQFFLRFDG